MFNITQSACYLVNRDTREYFSYSKTYRDQGQSLAIGAFWMIPRSLIMMGSSELGFTFESTNGWTKLFPKVNPLFGGCCCHDTRMITMLFSFEISQIALFSLEPLVHLNSNRFSKSKICQKFFTFRLFTHVCAGSYCVNEFW